MRIKNRQDKRKRSEDEGETPHGGGAEGSRASLCTHDLLRENVVSSAERHIARQGCIARSPITKSGDKHRIEDNVKHCSEHRGNSGKASLFIIKLNV